MNHEIKKFDMEGALDTVDYSFKNYIPSKDSLEFFALMRLVEGADFEFSTPMVHYFMVDVLFGNVTADQFPYSKTVQDTIAINPHRVAIVASRGLAKSTVVTAFYPIYCAIKGKLPCGDKTRFHLLLGASAQGGAKVMSKAVQSMCEDSVFCKSYFEEMSFTETESRFIRKGKGKDKTRAFLIRYLGIGGNIRGNRDNYGERYDHAIMDDVILNTQAAYSEVQMGLLRELIASDLENGLVGGLRGRIFSVATPFRLGDPVVETLTSGGYTPLLLPICESVHKDMKKEEFKGAWASMHPYEAVIRQYRQAIASNSVRSFNQERMLRISSEDDRMITDDMIQWFNRVDMQETLSSYNIYITTDFSTKGEAHNDFSALSVWAVNSNQDHFLLDLCVKKQGLQEQYDELFRMVVFWGGESGRAVTVGIEVDGQQRTHIFALKQLMVKRNEWFLFGKHKGAKAGYEGILSKSSGVNKHERFRLMLPRFQNKKIWFPIELKSSPDMLEALKQIKHTSWENFAGHDDFCFTGDTKIKMADGTSKDIINITEGDEVMTFGVDALTSLSYSAIITGTKEVNEYILSDGTSITATNNHPILTTRGWVKISDITSSDFIIKVKECKKSTQTDCGVKKQQGITKVQQTSQTENVSGYISSFGKRLTVYSLKGMMSTIKIIIKIITP